VRLFLDTSTLLAACGSSLGASREIFRLAPVYRWTLIVTPYVLDEVLYNLPEFPPSATVAWANLRSQLVVFDDVLTADLPTVFPVSKDRPILFGALAWADVLLTLDQGDFGRLLGGSFYDLVILKPGDFLQRERAAGRL
jgi:predicted nucleic acid-binding protein